MTGRACLTMLDQPIAQRRESGTVGALPPAVPGLAAFNGLADADAVAALLGCCLARRWAEQVAAGRPYQSVAAAVAASDDAVAGLTDQDLRQALAGHPRIGERQGGWSGGEQAGVDRADPALARDLAEGNAAYERRFGHIYLVCATGRSGPELLDLLRRRLANEPEAERQVVRRELAKINALRLRSLLDSGDTA
jgi:2-oxo-4-hydroxy-4-carboxy-5-ureidoimidazoline decarboxylase